MRVNSTEVIIIEDVVNAPQGQRLRMREAEPHDSHQAVGIGILFCDPLVRREFGHHIEVANDQDWIGFL